MLKIYIYIGINAHVTLVHGRRTECEDRARILKQNSQFEPLPVSQGNILVRGPSQSVRRDHPDGLGGTFFIRFFT